MNASKFGDVRACVFDAYGTLLDVHSAVARHADRVGPAADALSGLWRTKQLEYTWLRSLMDRHVSFAQVTSDALDYALDVHGFDDPALRGNLLDAYETLDAYPEVASVLASLKRAGYTTAILSNGDPGMLERAVESAGIGRALDAILSVEPLGIYKPHASVYALACRHFGLPPSAVAFASANAWDAAGAAHHGLRVVWCNRFGSRRERLGVAPDAEVSDLSGMPAALGIDPAG